MIPFAIQRKAMLQYFKNNQFMRPSRSVCIIIVWQGQLYFNINICVYVY